MEESADCKCDPVYAARNKNKVAQQKYRDRQREKKAALVQQIAFLEKKLARVEGMHKKLDANNKALEGMAACLKDDPSTTSTPLELLKSQTSLPLSNEAYRKDIIYDWAICFAEYVNATRAYKEPQCTPKQMVGHAMTPTACRNLRMNCAQICWELLHQKPITAEMLKKAEDFIQDTRKKKMRLMEIYCNTEIMRLGNSVSHVGVSGYDPHVTDLARFMELSQSQIRMLLHAKQECDSSMAVIRKNRQAVMQQMRVMLSWQPQSYKDMNEGVGSISDALRQLEGNLSAEGRCFKQLYDHCHQIVSPTQEAIGIANGYKTGLWFELWDLPSIVEQMQLEDDYEAQKLRSSSLESCST